LRTIALIAIIMGSGITHIEYRTFANNQLTSLTIGNEVTHIGERAFFYNLIESVIIPDNVTRIDREAFRENRITSITIGSNVSIDPLAFDSGFTSVYSTTGRRAGTFVYRNGTWGEAW